MNKILLIITCLCSSALSMENNESTDHSNRYSKLQLIRDEKNKIYSRMNAIDNLVNDKSYMLSNLTKEKLENEMDALDVALQAFVFAEDMLLMRLRDARERRVFHG